MVARNFGDDRYLLAHLYVFFQSGPLVAHDLKHSYRSARANGALSSPSADALSVYQSKHQARIRPNYRQESREQAR